MNRFCFSRRQLCACVAGGLALQLLMTTVASAAEKKLEMSRGYPPEMPGAKAEIYKRVGDTELKLYIFSPSDLKSGDKRPAIVFFFGGGWQNGSPNQFLHQCQYLASRGMVAISADYRVASRQQAKVVDCVRDAKSAIRWVREHAEQLGVDPNRIVASGGSAGGHLAAAVGTVPGYDEEGEQTAVSSAPNAMVLFNPALALAEAPGVKAAEDDRRVASMRERTGVDPKELSPLHHVRAGLPPTLILIGDKDFLLDGCQAYVKAAKEAGCQCTLDLYANQAHGFFNPRNGQTEMFFKTLVSTDRFLASLGYLTGEPTVDAFFAGSK